LSEDNLSEGSKGFSTSIYVSDRKSFEECKRLLRLQGRSISEEIMDFVCRKLDELKGTGSTESKVDSTRRLEELKTRYMDRMVKTVKLERKLKGSKHFDEATDLLLELGLNKDLSNADELIPKFMSSWKGDMSFMHEFLNLVDLARDKKTAEQALTLMRSGSVKAEPSQVRAPVIDPEEPGEAQKQLPVNDEEEDDEEEDAEENADLAEKDDDEGEEAAST
jgi:hypothetical protein